MVLRTGFTLGSTYHECDERQSRLTTSCSTRQLAWMPGCMLRLSIGVRTGGRPHPGQAGERLLKQRPHATSRWQGAWRSWFLCASRPVSGFVRALRGKAHQINVYQVHTRPLHGAIEPCDARLVPGDHDPMDLCDLCIPVCPVTARVLTA